MDITINQALNFWNQLVTAYMKCNTYGGDVAEIYLYSMMEHSSTFTHNPDSPFIAEEVASAKATILMLAKRFEKEYDCSVTQEDGEPLTLPGTWRWRIQVTRNKSV